MSRLADRLRELMTEHGLTQHDLAEQLGPTAQGRPHPNRVNVAKWLGGDEDIPPDRLVECSRIFSVPLSELVALIEPAKIGIYAVAFSRGEELLRMTMEALQRSEKEESAPTPRADPAGAEKGRRRRR